MRAFDFYEFVGILLPGSMLLIAIGWVFDIDSLSFLLIPNSFGGLGAHLMIAYVAGHLLQAVGNAFEGIYWRIWRGMPTDWPVTRAEANTFPMAKDAVISLCGSSLDSLNLDTWRGLVAQARSTIYASGRSSRLQFFNGTYGMFRGLIATELIIACFAWMSSIALYVIYPLLVVITIISFNRMHRFGVHYARELFANVTGMAFKKEA